MRPLFLEGLHKGQSIASLMALSLEAKAMLMDVERRANTVSPMSSVGAAGLWEAGC